jgi:DNA-binding LacI/PurR family transcriptional regulator
MATLKEVAKAAGVSVGTVSRVINNSPDVSDKRRELVLKIMQELNYQPNYMAQNLGRKHSQTGELGLVVTGIDNPANVEVIRGATEEANKNGYIVMLGATWTTPEIRMYLDEFIRRQVEGVAIASYMDSRTILSALELQNLGVPLAVCRDAGWPLTDVLTEQNRITTVDFESVSSCEQAVQYLIGLGHQRIAAITGNAELNENDPRLLGYKQALAKAGIDYDASLLFPGGSDTIMTGVHSMQEILSTRRDITAVFGFNDLLALGAMRALQEAGLLIPQNFSVIGFDNILMSGYMNPALSTINVPKYEIGCALIQQLIGVIQDSPPQHQLLTTNFVVRQSTGLVRA